MALVKNPAWTAITSSRLFPLCRLPSFVSADPRSCRPTAALDSKELTGNRNTYVYEAHSPSLRDKQRFRITTFALSPLRFWMRLVIFGAEMLEADVGVFLGGCQAGMAQEFLDGPEIRPPFE